MIELLLILAVCGIYTVYRRGRTEEYKSWEAQTKTTDERFEERFEDTSYGDWRKVKESGIEIYLTNGKKKMTYAFIPLKNDMFEKEFSEAIEDARQRAAQLSVESVK